MAPFFSRIQSLLLFNRIAIVTISSIYLVIFAGIFVRVTGSGMGCPDWPKCYGSIIPPTSIEQLTWFPEKEYSKGQMIIKDDRLFKAKDPFKSSLNWGHFNWDEISDSEHDYAEFSPFKTWVEYINRCLGAISGFFIIMLVSISFFYKKIPRYLLGSSVLLIFLSLVQYWLGRNVVYSVLESQKITIHFFVALIFIPILLFLVYKSRFLLKKKDLGFCSKIKKNIIQENVIVKNKLQRYLKKYFFVFLFFALVLSVFQMFFGTQVRGEVDSNILLALNSFELAFHRFLVPFIVFLNIVLIFGLGLFKNNIHQQKVLVEKIGLIFILMLLLLTGSYMYLFEIPESIKPKWTTLIHAYSSVLLFSIYVSLFLKKIIYRTI